MKVVVAFFRLIRWPNLFFILLTQVLFYYFIIGSSLREEYRESFFDQKRYLFYLLMLASVLIAAAGYIINDYFDLQIDRINKPGKVVVDRIVKRRWAIFWHFMLSLAGVLISIYVSWKSGSLIIAIANFVCVLLLWFYSTIFKKKLLIGNIVISALTAWVIVVIYLFVGAKIIDYRGWPNADYPFDIRRIFKLTMLYSGFAFIISLVREVIKDMEDVAGDAKYNCRTMPIAWGIPASKVFTGVWLVVVMAATAICIFYGLQLGWWLAVSYAFLFIFLPLVFSLKLLYAAHAPADYHKLSSLIKFIMLAGILSMIFFLFIP